MTGKSTAAIPHWEERLRPQAVLQTREGGQSRPSSCAHRRRGRGFASYMPALRFFVCRLTILLVAIAPCALSANAGFDGALRWRNVGPFRGGRTRAIAGVPSQPNVFYMAQVNGGVFKTIDYGRTWQPIFDDQPTGSVGAIAVSISNPEIVYVGSGEGLHRPDLSIGDGIYKSTDAGKTWNQLRQGLPEKIVQANLAVAPSSLKTLLATVKTLVASNIFRSEDGGESWVKTSEDLRPSAGIGGGELPVVRFDPKNPAIVYSASVVCWKSIDGGKTWEGWRGAPGGDDYQNIC